MNKFKNLNMEQLDELLEIEEINTGGLIFEEGYTNNEDGVIKNGKKVLCKDEIKGFHVYLSNNTKIEPIYELITSKKTYTGHFIDIEKQLYNESVVKTRNDAKELLNMIKFANPDRQSIRNDGGYLNLEDLPINKPDFKIGKDMNQFLNALDNNQAYAVKQLLLYGFANIIREKAVKPRGILKALILYGAKYSGKTLLTNLVRNMFTEEVIGFGDGGSPQSPTALRNSLANNIGIVLCDECDAKMVNKKRRTLYNEIEAIIKGVYQKELPKTSDLNNQGFLLNQDQIGIPVLTMNDEVKLTEALKDRIIAIEFDNSDELPILDLEKVKPELTAFGKALAYTFGKSWETLKEYQEHDELINRLLLEVENNYNINLDTLINSTHTDNSTTQKITDCIHQYLIHKLEKHIIGNDVDTALYSNWIKIPWIARVTDQEVIINQKKFNDFIKSNDCLNDGGISSKRISQRLYEETQITPEKKMKTISSKTIGTIIYKYDDFLNMFNLNTR